MKHFLDFKKDLLVNYKVDVFQCEMQNMVKKGDYYEKVIIICFISIRLRFSTS